jgi:hypothetical protein
MEGAIDPVKEWDENPQNPYPVTIPTGSGTLTSGYVAATYPDLWKDFNKWVEAEKTSELLGKIEERVALLYSGETLEFMELVAKHIAIELGYHVVTASYIFEKGSGKKIAFQPYKTESLNDFIKRFVTACSFSVILYSEQGGQLIETSWCYDWHKPTLGLVQFYRGSLNPREGMAVCPFLKKHDSLYICKCGRTDAFRGKVGGFICSDAEVFCPFTQQKITKMVFDMYITNVLMHIFLSEDRKELLKPVGEFLSGKL